MTHVFFTLLDDQPPLPREVEYLAMVQKEFGAAGRANLSLCAGPDEADLIVLLEDYGFKFLEYISRLERSALLAKYPEKIFTLNYEDGPSGALAGLYTSLRPDQYCAEIHHSWPHVSLPNERIYTRSLTDIDSARLLFSFRGNYLSHPLRAELGRLFGAANPLWQVEDSKQWYNHSGDQKESYLTLIEDAVFALCPRGLAAYSHRIGEVMALGRVPVIISDEWIPFCFEETEPYYIRIAEADMARIPALLQERRAEARTLAANARRLFERYLAIGNRFPEAVLAMQKIKAKRSPGWCRKFYADRWRSRKFWQLNGWTLEQRVMRKIMDKIGPKRILPT